MPAELYLIISYTKFWYVALDISGRQEGLGSEAKAVDFPSGQLFLSQNSQSEITMSSCDRCFVFFH